MKWTKTKINPFFLWNVYTNLDGSCKNSIKNNWSDSKKQSRIYKWRKKLCTHETNALYLFGISEIYILGTNFESILSFGYRRHYSSHPQWKETLKHDENLFYEVKLQTQSYFTKRQQCNAIRDRNRNLEMYELT